MVLWAPLPAPWGARGFPQQCWVAKNPSPRDQPDDVRPLEVRLAEKAEEGGKKRNGAGRYLPVLIAVTPRFIEVPNRYGIALR
jgi:hypothetical protein